VALNKDSTNFCDLKTFATTSMRYFRRRLSSGSGLAKTKKKVLSNYPFASSIFMNKKKMYVYEIIDVIDIEPNISQSIKHFCTQKKSCARDIERKVARSRAHILGSCVNVLNSLIPTQSIEYLFSFRLMSELFLLFVQI
jgi:hypothetical protein